MVTLNHLNRRDGRLELTDGDRRTHVICLPGDTPLETVASALGGQRYVIATSGDGRVAGLVAAAQIRQRLESPNEIERRRWMQMPLSALLNVTFSSSGSDQAPVRLRNRLDCVALTEDDRLFGIAVDDDIFLSWQRLESLLSVALSDPLTGLLNRLSYERRLMEEWSRAARTGMSVGVVIVDLDSFKRINDTLGHPAGDAVLLGVANELEVSTRSYDVVARFGGDEFVALCLGCAPGDIAIPIRRIQQGIAGMDLVFDGCPIPVAVSIGAAVRHADFDKSDPRELFSAADECLYHAKASAESAWKVELGPDCSGIPEPVSPMGTRPPSLYGSTTPAAVSHPEKLFD